jgi:radical SAM protein with 4Fe4S-binding SPASM domain
MLSWLQKTGAADIRALSREKQVRDILLTLLDMNIVEYLPEASPNMIECRYTPYQACHEEQDNNMPVEKRCRDYLSAPETVHLAVTYQCGENCPDCYAQGRVQSMDYELGTPEMCGITDMLADNGVFQLAVGGGEPFARQDLKDIVSHAADRGLAVHITTGQYILKPQYLDVLSHIKSLHIGIRSEELIHDAVHILAKLRVLMERDVFIGANLILTRFTIKNIDKLTELLLKHGFKRFIFLRYKPIADRERWNNENPSQEELSIFQNWLTQAKRQYPQLMLRIDCAAAFLMRDVNQQTAKYAGIRGCAAGERIISVMPDGSVYPCSQLVGHAYRAGNMATDSFKTIWHDSDVLNKYRNFRQSQSFLISVCGMCNANQFCGGCRIFAKDAIGGEPFCPLDNI